MSLVKLAKGYPAALFEGLFSPLQIGLGLKDEAIVSGVLFTKQL